MKERIITEIQNILESKLQDALNNFKQIQEALLNDSKSSAGDKHETARAMAQIELEQAGKQLNELERLIQNFKQINFQKTNSIKLGSLLEANEYYFFISIPLGKIEIDSKGIYCIGTQAPFYREIVGKKLGENFKFSNEMLTITSIS